MADEHAHGPAGGQGGQMDTQQLIQVFQQKIGNLELTVNALIGVLVDNDVLDQDELNEKAEEIVQEVQEQQQAQGQSPEDLADQLED